MPGHPHHPYARASESRAESLPGSLPAETAKLPPHARGTPRRRSLGYPIRMAMLALRSQTVVDRPGEVVREPRDRVNDEAGINSGQSQGEVDEPQPESEAWQPLEGCRGPRRSGTAPRRSGTAPRRSGPAEDVLHDLTLDPLAHVGALPRRRVFQAILIVLIHRAKCQPRLPRAGRVSCFETSTGSYRCGWGFPSDPHSPRI
jgi:hypothetical protein